MAELQLAIFGSLLSLLEFFIVGFVIILAVAYLDDVSNLLTVFSVEIDARFDIAIEQKGAGDSYRFLLCIWGTWLPLLAASERLIRVVEILLRFGALEHHVEGWPYFVARNVKLRLLLDTRLLRLVRPVYASQCTDRLYLPSAAKGAALVPRDHAATVRLLLLVLQANQFES